jgi:hypothetical protein
VSLRLPARSGAARRSANGNGAPPPQGSGPGGRITPDDIRAKANALAVGVEGQVESARPVITYAAMGAVLLIAVTAYWLGRRSGRYRSTFVEIRRE